MVLLLLIEWARAGAVFAGRAFFADSQDDEAGYGEDYECDNKGCHIFSSYNLDLFEGHLASGWFLGCSNHGPDQNRGQDQGND